jgi:hypothetical protein
MAVSSSLDFTEVYHAVRILYSSVRSIGFKYPFLEYSSSLEPCVNRLNVNKIHIVPGESSIEGPELILYLHQEIDFVALTNVLFEVMDLERVLLSFLCAKFNGTDTGAFRRRRCTLPVLD